MLLRRERMQDAEWAAMPVVEQVLDVDRVGGAVVEADLGEVPRGVAVAELVGVQRNMLRYAAVQVGMPADIGVRADRGPGVAGRLVGAERLFGHDRSGRAFGVGLQGAIQ